MSTSSADSEIGLLASRVNVGNGSTLAFFVDVIPGQLGTLIKFISGGTLEIIGVTTNGALNNPASIAIGTTFSGTDLANLSGTGYLLTANEVLRFNGAMRCYLSSTGATSIVTILKSRSQGF